MHRVVLGVAVLAFLPACSPANGYCLAAAECDENTPFAADPVGASDDSVNVCIAQQDGFVRSLRANEEDDCREAANAYERYMACAGQVFAKDEGDACEPFQATDNPCDAEIDDFLDALDGTGDDCSSGEE